MGSLRAVFLDQFYSLYINDLHRCIKYCTTYHFADDTNLLNISKNYKSLQLKVNSDLRSLHKWITANKISLNEGKTELIFFRKSGPVPTLKIKLHGKRLLPTKIVKYLGVYLDEYLSGEAHCKELVKKLNRGNGMLAKARHYVPHLELKNIYHAIFSSHLVYGAQVWSAKLLSVNEKVFRLQKRAMRIMTFSDFKAHSEPLFKELSILKFQHHIDVTNCIFVYDFLHNNLPPAYINTFTRLDETDTCLTRQASTGQLFIPSFNTTTFGLKCINKRCINSWNNISREINKINKQKYVNKFECPNIDLSKLSRGVLKEILNKHILSQYE